MTSSSHCGTHELDANDSEGSDRFDKSNFKSSSLLKSINITDNIQAANRGSELCN